MTLSQVLAVLSGLSVVNGHISKIVLHEVLLSNAGVCYRLISITELLHFLLIQSILLLFIRLESSTLVDDVAVAILISSQIISTI